MIMFQRVRVVAEWNDPKVGGLERGGSKDTTWTVNLGKNTAIGAVSSSRFRGFGDAGSTGRGVKPNSTAAAAAGVCLICASPIECAVHPWPASTRSEWMSRRDAARGQRGGRHSGTALELHWSVCGEGNGQGPRGLGYFAFGLFLREHSVLDK